MPLLTERTALAIRAYLLVFLLALILLISLPLLIFGYFLEVVLDLASGESAWYRKQRESMVEGRRGTPDAEFAEMVGADADDARFVLAIREAMAASIGVPNESIHPQDRMADLWRMQGGIGWDVMPIVFRLEEMLGARIDSSTLQRFQLGPEFRRGDFGEFATSAVKLLVRERKPSSGADLGRGGGPPSRPA